MKSCGLFVTTTVQYYRYDTQIIILEFKLLHMLVSRFINEKHKYI